MAKTVKKRSRVDRLQNLAIFLLTLSALALLSSIPLFGALSDLSLLDLAKGWAKKGTAPVQKETTSLATLGAPLRLVLSNDYTRLGFDALTTLDDAFNPSGVYLGAALGTVNMAEREDPDAFLSALRGTGVYFDFTAALPTDGLALALGVTTPELPLSTVRRALLCPDESGGVALHLADADGICCVCSTALGTEELDALLLALDGNGAEFAMLSGADYAMLAPETLILSEATPRCVLSADLPFSPADSADFLRRAEFNAYTENRYVESSGTVIVRGTASTLHLNPNGVIGYQGGSADPGSVYAVPSEQPNAPTLREAIAAAQKLMVTLTQGQLGEAGVYLVDARSAAGGYEVIFDYCCGGTPIRFADGGHAATVTVKGGSISAFSLRLRRYTATAETALLLPLRQAAAIARIKPGAELSVAYIDGGGETVTPSWTAD